MMKMYLIYLGEDVPDIFRVCQFVSHLSPPFTLFLLMSSVCILIYLLLILRNVFLKKRVLDVAQCSIFSLFVSVQFLDWPIKEIFLEPQIIYH